MLNKFKKFLLYILPAFFIPAFVFAIISTRSEQNIVPFTDNRFELGTSTLRWFRIYSYYGTSTTQDVIDRINVGGTATSTIYGNNSTSTLLRTSLEVLNVSTTTATSTFANGIQLVSGCFRLPTGSCAGTGGGGGTPGGSDTQVQFNDGGSFGGSANFTWSNTPSILTVSGGLISTLSTSTQATSTNLWISREARIASSTIATLTTGNITATSGIVAILSTSTQATTTQLRVSGTGTSTSIVGNTEIDILGVLNTTATSSFNAGLQSQFFNVTGSTASSTFAGGIVIASGRGIRLGAPTNCNGTSVLETNANGDIVCGADAGAGGGITTLNGLTADPQTFTAVMPPLTNGRYATLTISSVTDNHNFILEASSSPTYGFHHATSTEATSTVRGPFSVGTSTPFRNSMFMVGTSTSRFTVTNPRGFVGLGTDTPSTTFSAVADNESTTTIFLDTRSTTKGTCLVLKDVGGSGYTYLYATSGALYTSTSTCQ